jgi:hypothetical protein
MNTKTKFAAAAILALGFVVTACGDDAEETTATTTATTSTTSGMGGSGGDGGNTTSGMGGSGGGPVIPAVPTLGKQLDRMGRPAIKTATIATFDAMGKTAKVNAYSEDSDQSNWGSNTADIAKSIAIIDALDTVCGNQLLATGLDGQGDATAKGAYDLLAGVLANDKLHINLAGTKESGLYGAEAAALGVTDAEDKGGRKPSTDVIDRSYGLLAAGALAIDDKIPAPKSVTDAEAAGFPFLPAAL